MNADEACQLLCELIHQLRKVRQLNDVLQRERAVAIDAICIANTINHELHRRIQGLERRTGRERAA
jgi:hypothetical protein